MRQYESDKESRIFKFKQELEIKTEAFTIQIINEQLLIADRLLKTVMELVEGVEKIINLKSKQFFESLLVQAATLSKNINALREEQQNEFVLNEAKRKKAEAEAFLDKNNSNKEKFEQAMNILETLISDAGNDEMVAFFNQNMAEILDVFMTIHAPRDFTSIIFDRGELILVTKDMAHRSVRQISTGQRSALALSIFITMNRKLKYGPNIIMFDDPVAFIDDLNSLSFLDYLRYFVLKEGKQIFFATANAHLADLFEKKFSFMELDFQKHFLSRAES
jgi:ABC-type lipoprotein export system ATPase subunit